jgi:hypothetical protein
MSIERVVPSVAEAAGRPLPSTAELLVAFVRKGIMTGATGGSLLGAGIGTAIMLAIGTAVYIERGMPWHDLRFHTEVGQGLVIGVIVGGVIGLIFGLPLGILNGLLLALFSRCFCYPLRSEARYRWETQALSTITSAFGAILLLSLLPRSWEMDNSWLVMMSLAVIAGLFGGWASRYPTQWYIDRQLVSARHP